jgi:hypothetical protein
LENVHLLREGHRAAEEREMLIEDAEGAGQPILADAVAVAADRADARRLVARDIGVAVELAAEERVRLAAGRISRVGILVQGKGARFGQILESVLRG